MLCPFCRSPNLSVIDSRNADNGASIRRRRQCEACKRRFTTYEQIDLRPPKIIKHDGRREDFDENKIRRSLEISLRKRKVSTDALENVYTTVFSQVMSGEDKEISSRKVGEFIMRELYKLDAVAFVRFASVYKNFSDVDEFSSALNSYFSQEAQLPGLEQQPVPLIK